MPSKEDVAKALIAAGQSKGKVAHLLLLLDRKAEQNRLFGEYVAQAKGSLLTGEALNEELRRRGADPLDTNEQSMLQRWYDAEKRLIAEERAAEAAAQLAAEVTEHDRLHSSDPAGVVNHRTILGHSGGRHRHLAPGEDGFVPRGLPLSDAKVSMRVVSDAEYRDLRIAKLLAERDAEAARMEAAKA